MTIAKHCRKAEHFRKHSRISVVRNIAFYFVEGHDERIWKRLLAIYIVLFLHLCQPEVHVFLPMRRSLCGAAGDSQSKEEQIDVSHVRVVGRWPDPSTVPAPQA